MFKIVVELFDMVQVDKECGFVLQEGFFEISIFIVVVFVCDYFGYVVVVLGVIILLLYIDVSQLDVIVFCVCEIVVEFLCLFDYVLECGVKVVNMW